MNEKEYADSNGTKMSLGRLVVSEPEWATNRIRYLEELEAEHEALQLEHQSLMDFCKQEIRKLPPEYRKQRAIQALIDYGPNEA